MITDEQLDLLYDKHSNKYGEQSIPEWYAFCHELIALAQQVKPLVWYRRNTGWHTATDFGIYLLDEIDFDYRIKLVETPMGSTEMIAHRINGMDNAKDVAQQDYNRRVLSCLVWGGV